MQNDPLERWNNKRMKRFYQKAASLLMAAALLCTAMMTGCDVLDTSLPPPEEEHQEKEVKAYPKKAIEKIYRKKDKRAGLTEPTADTLEADLGLNPEDIAEFYIRYVDPDFGVGDVYIILPKEGEDAAGVSHASNVNSALENIKDDRIRCFDNYDIYNSEQIAENAVIFERGGYVVMLMLEDNDTARQIVERYIPEKLNIEK